MRVRLGIAVLVNSVFMNEQANITVGAHRINMGIPFLIPKVPSQLTLYHYQEVQVKSHRIELCQKKKNTL